MMVDKSEAVRDYYRRQGAEAERARIIALLQADLEATAVNAFNKEIGNHIIRYVKRMLLK